MRLIIIGLFIGALLATQPLYAQQSSDQERLRDLQASSGIAPLSDDQRASAISACNVNKSKLEFVEKASDAAVRKHIIVYETIQKELKALELRMAKQGADASELDLLIGKLQQKLDSFEQAARYNQQLVQDIVLVDCQNQPDLYIVGIQEYQKTRLQLYNDANELKETIESAPNNTFSPLIKKLRI